MPITKKEDFSKPLEYTKVDDAEKLRIQAVKDKIEASRLKREADGVVETKEEMEARKAQEAKELKGGIAKEDQVHIDARDARVKAVQAAIDEAKLKRGVQEVLGLRETEGVRFDRLAKEKKDLEEASVLNKIEPLVLRVDYGRSDLNEAFKAIQDKVRELIGRD